MQYKVVHESSIIPIKTFDCHYAAVVFARSLEQLTGARYYTIGSKEVRLC